MFPWNFKTWGEGGVFKTWGGGGPKPLGKGGGEVTPLGFSKPVSLWGRILSTVVVVGLIAGCRLNLSCCQSISQLELVGTGMM